MVEHTCKGDTIDPTHSCQCEIGRDHSASYHRQQIRKRAADPELANKETP